MDLRFEKEFPIYKGQFGVAIDLFNLFNSGAVTGVDSTFGTAGDPPQLNPNFGQPDTYVDPRQVRLGLRYTF